METVPGELAAPPVPAQQADEPTATRLPTSPRAAVLRAAELSGTWTAETAASNQAALAAISTGAARRDALQAAARLPTDPLLRAGQASSTATVEAIALDDGATDREGLVVTRERLTADDVNTQEWRVTLVTATRGPNGWAVARWEPQP